MTALVVVSWDREMYKNEDPSGRNLGSLKKSRELKFTFSASSGNSPLVLKDSE